MQTALLLLLGLAIMTLFTLLVLKPAGKRPVDVPPLPESYRGVLEEMVPFYRELALPQKQEFERRIMLFLARVTVTGVNTPVTDADRVLVAASAIIPIFAFPDWEYINLNEVLLYPDSFDHDFNQQGDERPILGMVGSGAMQGVMILSQHELRQSFLNETGKTNTAIHEFVHLVDKIDGSTDGIPEFLLNKRYILPWLELIRKEIQRIRAGKSDINPYGATNEAEFFAVVSEYFFERPDLLEQKNPELFRVLSMIFQKEKG